MLTLAFRIGAVTASIILLTLFPFLPGRYDSVAVPVSLMCQLFGKLGLLLVPVGIVWVAAEYWSLHAGKRFAFGMTALITSSFLWILVSMAAMTESLMLGTAALVAGIWIVWRLFRRLKLLRSTTPIVISPVSAYLLIVPVAVALIQFALAERIAEFTRSRAIRNSEPLIADIERYRAANGRYPTSVVSVNLDYSPRVIGIKEYRYELNGEGYNVLFEQPTLRLGTREIVMYNPRGEHVMTSHAMDILQLTPEQLALDRTRGHNAVHDAAERNWKYFWFD